MAKFAKDGPRLLYAPAQGWREYFLSLHHLFYLLSLLAITLSPTLDVL